MMKPMMAMAVLALGLAVTPAGAANYDVYVGTYTRGESQGIYRLSLDGKTGRLSDRSLSATTDNPSFLALHPGGKFLYAANESGGEGKVSAFAISEFSGGLTFLNSQLAKGGGTCHLTVDRTGRTVLAANYGGGSVVAFPLTEDGKLKTASSFVQHKGGSVNLKRQAGPHAHGIYVDDANRFVYVPDLGLDQVLIYRLNATAALLTPNEPAFVETAKGAGPRHLALHPKGKFAYVINEMSCTVAVYERDASTGGLTEVQTISTLPEGVKVEPGYSTAELEVHPGGKFLYGSNRGHDTIVVYSIDHKTGQLTLVQHMATGGKTPRNFAVSPDGKWLVAANQGSGTLVVFKVDGKTGKLSETGNTAAVPNPVCVVYRQK